MSIKKTNRGQAVDMSSLVLSNEETVAVGNMKVNARGDQLDANGNVVKTKTEPRNGFIPVINI